MRVKPARSASKGVHWAAIWPDANAGAYDWQIVRTLRSTTVITYDDGKEAIIGDQVDLDGWPAVVVAIIDSPETRLKWGLEEDGLMFETEAAGLVFEGVKSKEWDCWNAIILLQRAPNSVE
jgi:hypothetical protein